MTDWVEWQAAVPSLRSERARQMYDELAERELIPANPNEHLLWTTLAKRFLVAAGRFVRGRRKLADMNREALGALLRTESSQSPGATTLWRWEEKPGFIPNPALLIQCALLFSCDVREFFSVRGQPIAPEFWNHRALEQEVAPLNMAISAASAAGQELLDWHTTGKFEGTAESDQTTVMLIEAASRAMDQAIRDACGELPVYILPQKVAASTRAHEIPDGSLMALPYLDGGQNYVRGLPSWCLGITVGTWCGETATFLPICAAVHAPVMQETYSSMVAGMPMLAVREVYRDLDADDTVSLRHSIVATHFSRAHEFAASRFVQSGLQSALVQISRRVEALGCGLLVMCYIAAGRLSAYVTPSVERRSLLAGRLIFEAASRGGNSPGNVSELVGEAGDPTVGELGPALDMAAIDGHMGILAAATRQVHDQIEDLGIVTGAWTRDSPGGNHVAVSGEPILPAL